MRSNASGSDQKLVQLQDEIEELSVWKDKVIEQYKSFYQMTLSLRVI